MAKLFLVNYVLSQALLNLPLYVKSIAEVNKTQLFSTNFKLAS